MWVSKVTAVSLALVAFLPHGPHVSAYDHSDGFSPYGKGFAPDVVSIDIESDMYSRSQNATNIALSTLTPSSRSKGDLMQRAAGSFYLRVMPLGASITQGQYSSDENGYRKALRDQLRYMGWKVNMVGSLQDGTMADSVSQDSTWMRRAKQLLMRLLFQDHEGHRGWTITQVHDAWTKSKWMMPNLVLINVGL